MRAGTSMPSVSVIIPTCRSAEEVKPTLESIGRLERARHDVEFLVIQNGPPSPELANLVADNRDRGEWAHVHEPIQGLLAGRHRGAMAAKGEILAFLDDDVILSESWLEGLLSAFSDPGIDFVTGPCFPRYATEPPDWLEHFWNTNSHGRHLATLSLYDYGMERKEIDPYLVWGLNFGVRKRTLFELGGFHPDGVPWELRRYRGDGEIGLTLKARREKRRAVYEPRAALEHVIPDTRLTPEYFERRAFLQGISDSYTKTRCEYGAGTLEESGASLKRSPWRRFVDRIRRDRFASRNTGGLGELRSRIRQKRQEGYAYHQQELEHSPSLLEWVLRDNYWDYSYPQ